MFIREASASTTVSSTAPRLPRSVLSSVRRWIDTDHASQQNTERADRIDWIRTAPFIAMHAACLLVFVVGVSRTAVTVAIALYAIRMFAITGFYHRYFSHKTFRASRRTQFIFALIGASSVQRGPLWWAAHHRNHHRNADTELDPHSPTVRGFFWSHAGWFLTHDGFRTDFTRIPDLVRYPELRWLDRYDIVAPILLAVLVFVSGVVLRILAPSLGTNGWQLLVWGFFVSTIVLFHATVTINSLAHRFGSRRFATADNSKNNLLLAIITFGEGWHNNHHRYPGSARQGFRWWEIDITYYGLRALQAIGVVSHLRAVPARLTGRGG